MNWTPSTTLPATKGSHLVFCGPDSEGVPIYFIAAWDIENGVWRDDEGGLIATVTHWSKIAPMPDADWQPIATAPNGELVMTKIDDGRGVRNEGSLIRRGRLWFIPSETVYVYYQPTHWRPLEATPDA